MLAGCGQVAPTPPPASGPPPNSAAPTPSVTAPVTSPPATAGPQVKAAGSLKLFTDASSQLTGTCVSGQVQTVQLADKANDFFGTIDVAVSVNTSDAKVLALTIDLGEDSWS